MTLTLRPIPHDLIPRETPLGVYQGKTVQTIDFLAHAFPPLGSVPFDVVDVQNILPGATGTFTVINTGTNKAVIRWFGNEAVVAADYAGLLWTLFLNGIPWQPYVNMRESRGIISDPDPILIPIPLNTVVTISIINNNVGASDVKTRVKGWLY